MCAARAKREDAMTIEISKRSATDAFYREAANVVGQYRRLMKRPERKLRDLFAALRVCLGVSVAFLVSVAVTGAVWGADGATIAAAGLFCFAILLCAVSLGSLTRLVRGLKNDPRSSLLTLDERGAELNKENSQVLRMAWDNVAFVREFDESVCFFSKEATGFVISVPSAFRGEIFAYLGENAPGVRAIGRR